MEHFNYGKGQWWGNNHLQNLYLPLPEKDADIQWFTWPSRCLQCENTWLRACRSSRRYIWVTGSYSSLSLLEHFSGVHSTLRDERSSLLRGRKPIICTKSIRPRSSVMWWKAFVKRHKNNKSIWRLTSYKTEAGREVRSPEHQRAYTGLEILI